MNAFELLKADHRKVEDLFKQVEATDESKHPAIFAKIKSELDAHAHIEEKIFYPFLIAEGDEKLEGIVREGIEEHRQMKMFLKELAALPEDSDKFEAKLKVLMEDTKHHVKEEEREMFPKAKKQFDTEILEEIGAIMKEERKNFKQRIPQRQRLDVKQGTPSSNLNYEYLG